MDPDYLDALVDKADEMRKREKEERLDEKPKPPRIPPYDPQTDWPERYHGNNPWRPI